MKKMETKKNKCNHDWWWNHGDLADEIAMSGDKIGIPVRCSVCGAEGIEWYRNEYDVEITEEVE